MSGYRCAHCPASFDRAVELAAHVSGQHRPHKTPWLREVRVRPERSTLKRPTDCYPGRP